jgi:hypothetical protein
VAIYPHKTHHRDRRHAWNKNCHRSKDRTMDAMRITRCRSKDSNKSRDARVTVVLMVAALGCGPSHERAGTQAHGHDRSARAAGASPKAPPPVKPAGISPDVPREEAPSTAGAVRYRAAIEAQLVPGNLWAPIVTASSGASAELRVLVASAPIEAPGPRLTMLRFDNSGPDGTIAPTDEPRHPLVLSQPVLDNLEVWRDFRRFLSAPKTRSSYSRPRGCEDQTAAETYRVLVDATASLRDIRAPAQHRVDALATLLTSITPDVAFSPPHFRQVLDALRGATPPTVEQSSSRRASLRTTHGRWKFLRRDCWVVSNFEPVPATPQR